MRMSTFPTEWFPPDQLSVAGRLDVVLQVFLLLGLGRQLQVNVVRELCEEPEPPPASHTVAHKALGGTALLVREIGLVNHSE